MDSAGLPCADWDWAWPFCGVRSDTIVICYLVISGWSLRWKRPSGFDISPVAWLVLEASEVLLAFAAWHGFSKRLRASGLPRVSRAGVGWHQNLPVQLPILQGVFSEEAKVHSWALPLNSSSSEGWASMIIGTNPPIVLGGLARGPFQLATMTISPNIKKNMNNQSTIKPCKPM